MPSTPRTRSVFRRVMRSGWRGRRCVGQRPMATARTPRPQPLATTSRAFSQRRGWRCSAAADLGRLVPDQTSGAGFRCRQPGGWAAADARGRRLCLGCGRRREPLPKLALPGPFRAIRSTAQGVRRRIPASRRDQSRLDRRDRSAITVMQRNSHSLGIPIAGNVIEDRRCDQYLLGRSRRRGQRVPPGRVEFGEHVVEQ